MPKSISNRKHPSAKGITQADVEEWIDQMEGDPDPKFDAELRKVFEEKGLKLPDRIGKNRPKK